MASIESNNMSKKEAVKMFEDGTGLEWKVINPAQVRQYSSGHNAPVWTLCLNNACNHVVYVVPKNAQPSMSDYEKILDFLKKHGLPMLPKIKVDLDDFPAQKKAFVLRNFVITVEIKPTADIILQYKNSTNPVAYSAHKLVSLKHSIPTKLSEYLTAWNKISLGGSFESGHLKLKISNSITNEDYDVDIALEGNIFSATITPTPIVTALGSFWKFEGQIALQIKGTVEPFDTAAPPPVIISEPAQHTVHHSHLLIYVLVGLITTVGAALTIPTAGTSDVAAGEADAALGSAAAAAG